VVGKNRLQFLAGDVLVLFHLLESLESIVARCEDGNIGCSSECSKEVRIFRNGFCEGLKIGVIIEERTEIGDSLSNGHESERENGKGVFDELHLDIIDAID